MIPTPTNYEDIIGLIGRGVDVLGEDGSIVSVKLGYNEQGKCIMDLLVAIGLHQVWYPASYCTLKDNADG